MGLRMGRHVLFALALVVLVHHPPGSAEEEETVQLLDAAEVDIPSMAFPIIGEGSGSGSGSGYVRKKPYENHIEHNSHSFATEGGWTPAMEKKTASSETCTRRGCEIREEKDG